MKKSITTINSMNQTGISSFLFNLGMTNLDSARIENRIFNHVSSSNDEYIRLVKKGW